MARMRRAYGLSGSRRHLRAGSLSNRVAKRKGQVKLEMARDTTCFVAQGQNKKGVSGTVSGEITDPVCSLRNSRRSAVRTTIEIYPVEALA